MGLPSVVASLLRILWLAAAVFHSSALAAFNVHISTFHETGTSVFNVSLNRNWTYVLHPTLTGTEAKEHVKIDSDSGEIYLKTEIDCSLLHENPLILYAQIALQRAGERASGQTDRSVCLDSIRLCAEQL